MGGEEEGDSEGERDCEGEGGCFLICKLELKKKYCLVIYVTHCLHIAIDKHEQNAETTTY